MDAIDFLKAEHQKFRNTFALIARQNQNPAARKRSFAKLLHDLKVHETMEQKEWYPYLPEKVAEATVIRHLIKEEKQAGKAISRFRGVPFDSETWWRKFNQLWHDVLHHAHEEETRLFPRVRRVVAEKTLQDLGRNMRRFKRQQA